MVHCQLRAGYGFGVPKVAKTNYVFDARPSDPHMVPVHQTGFAVSGDTTKNVVLVVGFILSGTVYAPGGTIPVANAWVSIYNPATGVSYGVTTDANGHYSIVAPSYSNYVFDVTPPSPYNPYHESGVVLTSDTTKNVTLPT